MTHSLTLLPNKDERSGKSTFLADEIMDLDGILNAAAAAVPLSIDLDTHNTTLLMRRSSMFAND